MITRIALTGILAGLALFSIVMNTLAQRSYSRTTVEYRAGWYPATPEYAYSRTEIRTYGHPYAYDRERQRRYVRPHDPYRRYAYPHHGFSYGYRMPVIYPYYTPVVPPVPVYTNVPAVEPPPIPLSKLFLVTNVVLCHEDGNGIEQCDAQANLAAASSKRCKPILEKITRARELSRGYQVVASFRKRASGRVEATVRISPLIYHPELTHRTLTSAADTSYHALAVFLLESGSDVE